MLVPTDQAMFLISLTSKNILTASVKCFDLTPDDRSGHLRLHVTVSA